jgi:hypothetical protein
MGAPGASGGAGGASCAIAATLVNRRETRKQMPFLKFIRERILRIDFEGYTPVSGWGSKKQRRENGEQGRNRGTGNG